MLGGNRLSLMPFMSVAFSMLLLGIVITSLVQLPHLFGISKFLSLYAPLFQVAPLTNVTLNTTSTINTTSITLITTIPTTTINGTTTIPQLNLTNSTNNTITSIPTFNITVNTTNTALSASIVDMPSRLPVDRISNITVNATGGTPPYTYQWYEITPKGIETNPAADCINGSATSSTCQFYPTGKGRYYIGVNVTDSSGTVFNIDPYVNVTGVFANVTPAIIYGINGSIDFTGMATGSPSGLYSLTWEVNGTQTGGALTCTYYNNTPSSSSGQSELALTYGANYQCSNSSFNLTEGNYNITFTAADALNASDNDSATAQLVVDWPSGIFSDNTINSGQSTPLTVAWQAIGYCGSNENSYVTSRSDCSPESSFHSYTYTVNLYQSSSSSSCNIEGSSLGSNSLNTTSSLSDGSTDYYQQVTFTVSPIANTIYCAEVDYNPTSGINPTYTDGPSTATITVKALSTPLSVSITPSSETISADQAFLFTANAVGGTPSYKYKWSNVPPISQNSVGCSSSYVTGPLTCGGNITTAGNYVITVTAEDSNTPARTASNTVTLVVTPPLSTKINANWTFISADQKVSFTNTTTGGTGSIQNKYTVSPTGGTTVNGNVITFTSSGTYTVTLTSNDASGEVSTNSISISVAPPLVTRIIANRTYVSADQAVSVTNSSTGGTEGDVNTYSINPQTGVNVNGNIYTFSSSGNYIITLTTNDLTGESATNTVTIQVVPALTVQLNANWTYISTGQTVIFSNTTGGGTGSDHYTLTFSPSTGIVHTSGQSYVFNTAGNYIATLTENDASGEVAISNVLIQVTPPLTIQLSTANTHVVSHAPVLFTNTTLGGTGNDVYSYTVTVNALTPGGSYTQSGNTITFTAPVYNPTIYNVTIHVRDKTGEINQSSLTMYVNETLEVNTSNIQYPGQEHSGIPTFSRDQVALITDTGAYGGVPPYTFQWLEQRPGTSGLINAVDCGAGNSQSYGVPANCVFATSSSSPLGQYEFVLQATDSENPAQSATESTQYLNLNASLRIVSFNGNWSYISPDQNVKFTNITVNGTGADVWTTSELSGPSGGMTLFGNNVYSFTKPGNYIVKLYVSDISGENATALTYVNVTPPLETTLHANWTYISADQSVKFTNTTTGGTGNDISSYTITPSTGWTASGNVYTFTSQGNYTITLHVSDKTGETNQSTVKVNVTAPLQITSFTNTSRLYISTEQPVFFTNTTIGGTGSNAWTYFVNGVPTAGNANKSITFPSSGTYTVTLGVKDKTGEIANWTSGITVTVTPPLTISLNPNWTTISAGQKVSFTNTTHGGTGSNVYSYSIMPSTGWSQSGNIITFNAYGTYAVTENVIDASGETNSSSATIDVTPPLRIVSFHNTSRTYISAGQSVSFTNVTVNGTGSDVWTYFVNGVPTAGNANKSITFSSTGTYTVTLGVKDKTGEIANSTTITVQVTPALIFTEFIANWTYISAGQKVLFTNTTSGGTGNDVYSYSITPSTGWSQSGNVITFSSSGNYVVTENVIDASGETNQTQAITIQVASVLKFTSFTANWTTISTGQAVIFTNTTSGGTGSDVYSYTISGPEGGYTQTGNTITFTTAGYYTVIECVSDATGETNQTQSIRIHVTAPLKFTLFEANRTYISTGQAVLFTNATSGGTGNDVYSYTITGPAGYTQSNNKFTFTTAGNYVFTENVIDKTYETNQTQQITVQVTPPLEISLVASRTYISAGQNVTFTNTTSGGTANITYSYGASPEECAYAGPNMGNEFNFPGSGTCTITEYVHDTSGETNSSSVTVTITPPLETTITPNWTYISAGQKVSFTNTTTGGTDNITNTYTGFQTAPGLYYTGYTSGGYNSGSFFRSTVPVNAGYSDATLSEGFSGSAFDISLTQDSSNGYDLGYYFNAGTLGSLAANGLAISATGTYGVNLWLNVQDWTWSSNIFTGLGANGGYGLGPSSPSSINGATSFYITAGPCEGNTYTVSQLASGACASFNANTPISIWIGVGPLNNAGTTSADISTPYIGTSTSGDAITFPSAGNYTVTLTSTDTSGEVAIDNTSIKVTPVLEFTGFEANRTYISTGQSVLFTNTTTGGTGSNVYSYAISGPEGGYTQSNNKFTFTTAGTYTVTEHATDASGETNQTQAITVTVKPPLEITLDANWTYISADQKVAFTNFTTGGTGNDTFSYSLSCTGEGEGPGYYISGNIITFSHSGNCIVTENVIDTSGETNSSAVTITITPQLRLTSLIPNRTFISAGQAVLFTNTTSGGTGNNIYSYSVNTESGWSQSGNVITFTSPGTYQVTLTVTDATGETSSQCVTITVTPALDTQISANWTYISAGQKVSFTNTTTGGTYNITNMYSTTPSVGSSVDGNIITFTSAGNYIVTLTSTDTSGEVATSNIAVAVAPALEFTGFIANWTTVSTGQSVLFTNTTSGGTGNEVYSYTIRGPEEGWSQSGNVITFYTAGNYYIIECVTDLTGETNQTQSIKIHVTAPLELTSFTGTTPISVDQYSTFTNTTTGGTGNNIYSYALVSGPEGGAITYLGNNEFSFSVAGNYVISENVIDQTGETNSSTFAVQVNPELTLAALPSISIDQYQQYTFYAIAGNGTPPYSYAWTVGSGLSAVSGCGGSDNTCTVNAMLVGYGVSARHISVKVTDASAGEPPENVTQTALVNVYPPLSVKPPTSSHSLVDQGQLSVESSSVIGGSPPYTTEWLFESPQNLTYILIPGSVQTSNSVITQYLFLTNSSTQIGDWEYEVQVVDNSVFPEMANAINQEGVTVYPQLLAATSANRTQVTPGNSSKITASISGGSNPVNFVCQWYSEQPGSSTFSPIGGATSCNTYTFITNGATTRGTWLFRVQVTDTGTTVFEIVNSTQSSVTVGRLGISLTGSSVIDSGQSDMLTATTVGGTPPYTYTWSGADTGSCNTVTNSLTDVCDVAPTTLNPEILTYNVMVTDATSNSQSAALLVTLNPTPTATFTPLYNPLDSGLVETYEITVNGGTGPFQVNLFNVTANSPTAYSTTILSPGSTGGISVTTNDVGNFIYQATVVDEGVSPAYSFISNSNTITVNPDLGSLLTVVPQDIDVDGSAVITASISGGSSPYVYYFNVTTEDGGLLYTQVTGTPSTTSSTTYQAQANAIGNDIVNTKVTDITYAMYGGACYPAGSPQVKNCEILSNTITVNQLPSVTITPSNPTIDNGQTITLTSHPSGGSLSYTSYAWYQGSSCTGNVIGTSTTYTTPSLTSATTYCVEVTDSLGGTGTGIDTVNVNGGIAVTASPSVSQSMDLGQGSIDVSASATGGTGNYIWTWSASDCPGTSSGTGSSYSYTPSAATLSCSFTFTANDGITSGSGTTAQFSVYNDPQITAIAPESQPIQVGQPYSVSSSITDPGSGADTYQWYNSTNGVVLMPGQTSPTLSLTAGSVAGTFDYYVVVTDSNGGTGQSSNAQISITYPELGLSITPNLTSINAGQSVSLISQASGGSGIYSYGAYYSNAPSYMVIGNIITFNAIGTFSISQNVIDSANEMATGSTTITVNQTLSGFPSNIIVNVTANTPTNIVLEDPIGFLSIISPSNTALGVTFLNYTSNSAISPLTSNSTDTFTKLEVFLLNVTSAPPVNGIVVDVNLYYACGTSVAPYVYNLASGTWSAAIPTTSTINASTCDIMFSVPADPIFGMYSYAPTSTSSPGGGGGSSSTSSSGGGGGGGGGGPSGPSVVPFKNDTAEG